MSTRKLDREADVVVVGYGGAGATAAITAHDLGADVLILEKAAEGGGNTRVSAGNFCDPGNTPPAKYADYLETICHGTTERVVIDAFVEGAYRIRDWIEEMGGGVKPFTRAVIPVAPAGSDVPFPGIPGGENLSRFHMDGPEGTPGGLLWDLLRTNVERRDIPVLTSSPAKHLLRSADGEVSGVVAEVEGRELVIGARRAVILTCGGFENDPQLKWDFLMPRGMRFQGSPSNTGDGVRMAAEVGSSLWHMGAMASGGGVQVPGFEAAFSVSFMAPGFIYVDRHGHRFFEETYLDLHQYWEVQSEFDTGRFEHPRVPMYAIFDEEVRLRAPLVGSSSGYSGKALGYQWSADNSEEINKGWIMKSTSLLELAEKAGLDGQALEATVARYNEHCAAGNDPDFHRPPKTLKSIQGPPYYAVEIWPVLLNTQGGPRRDEGSRVLDSFGKPIPRLYAAGELGSIWGFHYHTSSNLAECIVYGRIAGRNAAQVEPIG